MLIQTRQCHFCNQGGSLEVPQEGVEAYQGGAFVQDAFPSLSASEREQIMTGTHPKCWDDAFGALEEEPEE